MAIILSLIGSQAAAPITQEVVEEVSSIIARHGASVEGQRCLASGIAWECLLAGAVGDRLAQELRDRFGAALDVNFIDIPDGGGGLSDPRRRMRLLIPDMDSTILAGETLDELAAHAGLRKEIAAVTAHAMNGDLDFEEALRARAPCFGGCRSRRSTPYWNASPLPMEPMPWFARCARGGPTRP